jgi:hypothetical protein
MAADPGGPPAFAPLLDGRAWPAHCASRPGARAGRPTIPWPAGPVRPGGSRTGGGSGSTTPTPLPAGMPSRRSRTYREVSHLESPPDCPGPRSSSPGPDGEGIPPPDVRAGGKVSQSTQVTRCCQLRDSLSTVPLGRCQQARTPSGPSPGGSRRAGRRAPHLAQRRRRRCAR